MSAHPTPDAPAQPAGAPHPHQAVLDDLIAMGADLARALHAQATAHTQAAQSALPPTPRPDPDTLVALAAAFDRTARAVRRCVLLSRALAQPAAPLPDPARHRAAARKQIIRAVEDTIQRPCFGTGRDPDSDTADALRAELHERLDAPDLDDDIAARPVADIIKEIRRDLGLDVMPGTRPFQRRTPADVAQLCARAAAPSRPSQPGAAPQDAAPHSPRHGAAHRSPGPANKCDPDQPAVAPRTRPAPVHPTPPSDPARAVAFVLRHAAPTPALAQDGRWRPPAPP